MNADDVYAEFGPFGKDLEALSEDYLFRLSPNEQKTFVSRVAESQRRVDEQRSLGTRPRPSQTLRSIGNDPKIDVRNIVLDIAAKYADKAPEGRSRQCVVFAAIARAILELGGVEARLIIGRAEYKFQGKTWGWDHAWLEVEGVIIDGNMDVLDENAMAPKGLRIPPYWGPKKDLKDRVLKKRRELLVEREAVEIDENFPRMRREAQEEAMRLVSK